MPIINLAPAADVAEQNEPEPPQELAPRTAFTASVFDKVDRLEDQDVNDIAQVIDAAAVEAEPTLKRATACDLAVTPIPAPQEQECRQ